MVTELIRKFRLLLNMKVHYSVHKVSHSTISWASWIECKRSHCIYMDQYPQIERISISVKFYTRVQEVLSSNFGLNSCFPGWDFRRFPQCIQANSRILSQLSHEPFLPNLFQFIIYKSSYPYTESFVKSPTYIILLSALRYPTCYVSFRFSK
jgi:hypothetical protein